MTLQSFFTADSNGWAIQELDQGDAAYGLQVSHPALNQIVANSKSMDTEFTLTRINGIAHTKLGNRVLLLTLVDSGPLVCRAYFLFENEACSTKSFWTPQWRGPKAKLPTKFT